MAALLLAALVLTPAAASAAPSFDATNSGSTNAEPTPAPAPAPAPKPAPTPAKPAPADPTPAPTDSGPSTGGSSSSDSGSAIQTPLTPQEQQFREELAKRQGALSALQAQLDQLDSDLEIATENFNAAQAKLEDSKKKLDVTQKDLDNAEKAYQQQISLLQERIRVIYRGGTLDTIGLLLDSQSVSDFVSRIKFLNLISEKDADLAATLAEQRDQTQQSLLELKDAKLQAEQLEFQLKARRIEIQLRITERQQMLASAQADLLALLGRESSQRQADEAKLFQQILAGAANVGVTVQPGSPVETALAYHGIPYVWGGATPSGFDCSGLMLYVFAQHGVTLPHYSGDQFQLGIPVALADLKPGDAVFFGNPIHHVGMYMGNDYFIEAPYTGSYVRVSRLSSRFDFAGARRYPWVPRLAPIWGVSGAATDVNALLPK